MLANVNDQLIQPKSQSIHTGEYMLQIYLDYSLSPNDLSDIELETTKLEEKSQDLWTARRIVSSAAIVNNLLFHPKRLVEKV